LKERFAADGSKIATEIKQPVYLTFAKSLEPPFEKDEYFKKNEKFFITGGPYLWISKLLYERGPLTRKEIWSVYSRDASIDKTDVPIDSR
jgi:hypothetical protein